MFWLRPALDLENSTISTRDNPMTLNFAEDSIAEETLVERVPRRRTIASGRVCVTESCTTILSIYNKSPRCYLHDFDRRRP